MGEKRSESPAEEKMEEMGKEAGEREEGEEQVEG